MRYPIILCILLLLIAAGEPSLYPDPKLTPGVVDPRATREMVCVPNYTDTVRRTTDKTKNDVMERYHYLSSTRKLYEIDHFIPLEIGGADHIDNLWPEPWDEARRKDKVENWLHRKVCQGDMTIEEAQDMIKTDWVKVYKICCEAKK